MLCDLVVLEQFKNSLPSHITTYINEHKIKTAFEAAKSADEYVSVYYERDYRTRDDYKPDSRQSLDANRRVDYKGVSSQSFPSNKRGEEGTSSHPGPHTHGYSKHNDHRSVQNSYDPNKTCNYCKNRGHYKGECPNRSKI